MIYVLQPVPGLGEGYTKIFEAAGRDTVVISLSQTTMNEIETVESGRDDIFVLVDAHLPIVKTLSSKQGRIYGVVQQATRFSFDPCLYDGLFVETLWAQKRLSQLHPEIASRLYVTPSPFDPSGLLPFCKNNKTENRVVFTQAFTQENLHIFEVYLADLLIQTGYKAVHLFLTEIKNQPGITADTRGLIREGEKRGMEFISCETRDEYFCRFAEATVMIMTAPSGNAVSFLQATSLGVTTLAPCFGDFPEFLPKENLYRPFNLNHILLLASSPPAVPDIMERFLPENCWQRILAALDDE
ncbi:MAG: hypothetical protein KGZ63_06145 [Clostridiales bacterium]|nr:hypothetical protein [Clostridiales bacterium]